MQYSNMTLDRVQRLKDARSEATKEIEALKAHKQAEYAQFEKNVCLPFAYIDIN
jgi:predicted house-cleaning noncanonical NTP pyrophosphatase (MazG superfamily)